MRKTIIAGIVLMSLPVMAQTTGPFTSVDKLSTEKAVRHLSGQELGDTMKKGMTPGCVLLSDIAVQA